VRYQVSHPYIKVNVNVKLPLCFLTEHNNVKAYRGSEVTAPRTYIGTRWRWVVTFTLLLHYLQGKSPWYPLERGFVGTQSRSGHGGEEKNSHLLPGLEPPDYPDRSPALYKWTILALNMNYYYKSKYVFIARCDNINGKNMCHTQFLPQHYVTSQPIRPRLESSPSWRFKSCSVIVFKMQVGVWSVYFMKFLKSPAGDKSGWLAQYNFLGLQYAGRIG